MSDPLEGPRWPSNALTYSFAGSNLADQLAPLSDFITDPGYQAVV
jgi:hypothetical protein